MGNRMEISPEKTKKQNALVDRARRDAKTMPLANDKLVETIDFFWVDVSKA